MSVPSGGSRVLVIEEHPFQRRALVRRLNELGVPRVLAVAGCADALAYLSANARSIALILSSLDMPETDGIELLRTLGIQAPHIAVAVLTAFDHIPVRRIAARAAARGLHLVGVLEKPVSDDALRAVLVRAVSGESCDPMLRAGSGYC